MSPLPLTLLAAAPGGSPLVPQLMMMAVIFAIFYLLVFAPMRKKQKKHAEMVGALKNGDKVVTNGGIHGTVVGVTDQVIQLRIAEGVKIEISRNAVAGLQGTES
jgi:preprotein translocase subunit YajC